MNAPNALGFFVNNENRLDAVYFMAVLAREGQLRYVGGRDANVRGGLLLNVWPGCNCIQNLVMTNRDTDVKEHYQEFDMKLMNSLKTRLYEFNLLKKSDVTEHRLLLLSANKKNIHHRFNFLVNLNPDALRDTIWKKIGIQFCDIIGICDKGTEDSIGRVNCPTLSSVSRIVSDPHRAG